MKQIKQGSMEFGTAWLNDHKALKKYLEEKKLLLAEAIVVLVSL